MTPNPLTKIIATLGPATESKSAIKKLIQAGVSCFRFNFKHNTVEWHSEHIRRVQEVSKSINQPVSTLIDLQGPEIRINMPWDNLALKKGEEIIFGPQVFKSREKGFSISHPKILTYLQNDQKLLADDGAFSFTVRKNASTFYLKCHETGTLLNRKSLNIPDAEFPFPVLLEKDVEGLSLAQKQAVDYVALSFIRSRADIKILKQAMAKNHLQAKIVAKIETQHAIDNLEDILQETQGVMVARGDLGVELPLEQIPALQKYIIRKSIEANKFVITATQMLESMITNPYPTRAEISDIATATSDYTDAVMLSGETATGKYPISAVKIMAKTLTYNEVQNETDSRQKFAHSVNDLAGIICDAAYDMFLEMRRHHIPVAGFIVFTHTGRTAWLLAKYRPLIPIYAICVSSEIADSLRLNFAINPQVLPQHMNKDTAVTRSQIHSGLEALKAKKVVKAGGAYIVLHGDYWAVQGGTQTVKVITA